MIILVVDEGSDWDAVFMVVGEALRQVVDYYDVLFAPVLYDVHLLHKIFWTFKGGASVTY